MSLTATMRARIAPFDLGRGPDTVLLLHGFTGTPFEMRWLGGRLARRGFRAVGPRLPGHDLDPYALERSGAADWVDAARQALLALPEGRPVFLAGLSMGALLAAHLAAEFRERIAGLALCAPAVGLTWRSSAQVALLRLGVLGGRPRFYDKGPSRMVDPAMREKMPRFEKVPTRALVEFDKVRALGRRAMRRLSVPTLLVYSESDTTVPPAAARSCTRLLREPPVKVVRLERSSHVVTVDVERERVAEEIGTFFRTLS